MGRKKPSAVSRQPSAVFCCGRRGNCPDVTVAADGRVVLSEAAGETLAVPGGRRGIALRPEEAAELRRWLETNGF